uniref:Major facilitator superfamily (MFS) profile domain-containing protein n=1 Tax=Clastoptera arizonana TaxID=38151 RepID=A0A1B6C5Z8_9HEMI
MSSEIKDVPIGIKIIQRISDKFFPNRIFNRNLWYRSSVLVLTFLAYTTYHASRKPISVVKTILHRNCSGLTPPSYKLILDSNNDTWCDWAPFDGPNATQLLGTLDSSFLFAYGAAMFMSGLVAERVSLRYFLALGMIFSGIASYLLGIAHSYGIHSLQYFIIVQIFGGIVQTTGWPGVVAVMGNWFGKGKRGLIFGIWNSHTSIGNALGTFVAARFASSDWGLSFIVPGVIIATTGFIVFLFLVPNPADVNCVTPEQNRQEIRDKTIVQLTKVSASTTNEVNKSRHVRKRRENGSVRYKTKTKVQVRSVPNSSKPLRQFLKSVKNVHTNQENNVSLF